MKRRPATAGPYTGRTLKPKPERGRLAGRILEESDVARLIERTPEGRDQMIVKLFYTSGIRVSELCELRWSDAVRRGDGGQTRAVLLKPRTWRMLEQLCGSADLLDPIFRSRKGPSKRQPNWIPPKCGAFCMWRRSVLAWNRKFRRTGYATRTSDAPIHLLQATLVHAPIATTGKYLHPRPNESSSSYLPD